MNLENKTVLILGGAGLVGQAVARRILAHGPARVVLTSLREAEAREAAEALATDHPGRVEPAWGDLFVLDGMREMDRESILSDPARRGSWISDLYGELTAEVLGRSALGALLERVRPDAIVDCINTAGALAYQNAFASAAALRERARTGVTDLDAVERHLATLYLPQLIRHVQIALEGMRRAGTQVYVKIGTAGTGGMGLNIPFTHSEERPSRVLLAKAGLAGAHTLLLYLMARTPGAPAVKEVKPTAAISWKSIGYGVIKRGGRPVTRVDATAPQSLGAAFAADGGGWTEMEQPLEGVYLDAGENGLFTLNEFEVLTSLGLMEFLTPEEIADNVVREIQGYPTGRDVVAALDASTMGPTYRAGVMRAVALDRMEALEREHGTEAVAYEMLGPPRLSKLLFEGALLRRLCGTDQAARALDADEAAAGAQALVEEDADVRQRILTAGLPILFPSGDRVLRGRVVHAWPDAAGLDERAVERGWVDLRASNWARWRSRFTAVAAEQQRAPTVDHGSLADHDPSVKDDRIRPGQMAAWILRREESGERIKR
ncbi:MAG: short-chain dehydrogenase [Gemmatimonadota bacterium]